MEAPRALAGLRSIAGFAALVVSLLSASTATATAAGRDVVLRFMQPDGQHDLFYRAYVSDIASGIEHVIEAGIASPDGDGVGQIVVELDDASSFRMALTAENEIGESPRSNSIVIAASAPTCDPRDCDDGDPCTTDVCFGDACLSEPAGDGTRCDDGFVDTVDDQCVAGVCEGVLLACRGEADCDDGNVCNGLEVCDGGTVCLEGIPLECGEPTACEVPRCDAVEGCVVDVLADGTPCDDGRDDTRGDVCIRGLCSGDVPVQDPGLAIDAIEPRVISPRIPTFAILGNGFTPGTRVRLSQGKGRAPRVEELLLLDGQLMEATIQFSHKGPKRAQAWDVHVVRPDGEEVKLPGALRIER